PRFPIKRDDEAERPNKGPGIFQQQSPLVQGFVNEMKTGMFQITQAAVHKLGGDAARPGGKVALVDQGDSESSERRIQGDAGAGDAAAEDEQVKSLVRESVDIPFHA